MEERRVLSSFTSWRPPLFHKIKTRNKIFYIDEKLYFRTQLLAIKFRNFLVSIQEDQIICQFKSILLLLSLRTGPKNLFRFKSTNSDILWISIHFWARFRVWISWRICVILGSSRFDFFLEIRQCLKNSGTIVPRNTCVSKISRQFMKKAVCLLWKEINQKTE